jgi:hypothetical protein
MITHELRTAIAAFDRDPGLHDESNFEGRLTAIDYLDFHIIDRIDGLPPEFPEPEELTALKHDAERVKRRLEETDDRLFRRLRARIRDGSCTGTALKDLIDGHVPPDSSHRRQRDEWGYDGLDAFINALLLTRPIPAEASARKPEMVQYQQTPARVILELVEKAALTDRDVFYDLGSGLGHVPILVNLLSGATAKGVEFDPAYWEVARSGAAGLNLSGVAFVNADACTVDYSDGTVFFMYTPFEGHMLEQVLRRLERESRTRMVRVFTYGPCTARVSRQEWLECVDPSGDHMYRLGAFRSLGGHHDG